LEDLPQVVKIRLGNQSSALATKGGQVTLYGLILQALYIPEFRLCLVSLGELDQAGLKAVFVSGVCQIWKTGQYGENTVVLQARYTDRLYVITRPFRLPGAGVSEASRNTGTTMVSTLGGHQHLADAERPLHKRLAHLNHQAVHHVLTSGSYTHTADGSHKPQCSTCILSKQHRTRSQEPAKRTGSSFELIHSDSCGPLPLSHGSARYYIIFIDDLTRYTFVYFLKAKQGEESRKCFENMLNYVETQFPAYKVKRFRSDNGKGEYENSLVRELLASKGIIFQPLPPYTQHKNSVSEQMIQTLNSRARSMLIDADLPIIFWAEVINAAVYQPHRSPSSALEGKSPLGALQPAEPIPLAHLRRFGCIAHHRIHDETRNASLIKFTPRARLCMMVGYSESTNIWRLWDFLGNNGRSRPIYSSDIVFIEEKNAINWQPDHEQPLPAGSLSPVYFA